MTVGRLIKLLSKFDHSFSVKVHERQSVYDSRVLGVNIDEQEKKRGKDFVKITVGF